ncbi:hypothetical protein LJ754_01985 [Arthrobacter sp. zg-Y40]|nr:hypothetical protein [Arthrobacter sp. zg-Y40]
MNFAQSAHSVLPSAAPVPAGASAASIAADPSLVARRGQGMPPAPPAVPAPEPPRAKTEAELREEKRRRDLRNINITLYSASLLLVAAAALFIGLAIPEQARFSGVVAVTALFYVSGLVIHARSRRLRPAAVAFTGTGLALIPVVGLALFNLVLHDGPAAWLFTSVAGTAAFAYAAAKIESRVVAYLALTFLLSSGLASGAALRWGIVWYFLSTVVLATLISLAAVRRPKWLNNLYLDAFVRSHRYLVPATAVASAWISDDLGAAQLAVLFLAFACYYAVMLWQGPDRHMLVNSYGLRAAGTVGLTALFYSFTDSGQATLLAFAVQVLAQLAGVLLRRPVYGAAALMQAASRAAGLPLDNADEARRHRSSGTGAPQTAGAVGGQGGSLPELFGADTPGAASVSLVKKPARTVQQSAGRFFRVDVAVLLAVQAGAGVLAGLAYAFGMWGGNMAVFAGTALVVLLAYLAAGWKVGGVLEFGVTVPVLLVLVPTAVEPRVSLWPAVLVTAALTAYLVIRAVRSGPGRRAVFVLAARAAAVLLVPLVLLASLAESVGADPGAWALAGTAAALAANQVMTVLRLRQGKPEYRPGITALSAAAGTVLLACGLRGAEDPGLALAGLWVLVAANVLTSVLHPRGRYLAAGPAGFLSAALIGAGVLGLRGYELLTAAALAYCVVLFARISSHLQRPPVTPRRPPLRGAHLLAAQALVVVLSGLVAADVTGNVHRIFAALAVSIGVLHLLRTLFAARIEPMGLAGAGRWGGLAASAAVPGAYALLPRGTGDPGSLLFLIACAAAVAVFTQVAAAVRLRRGRPLPLAAELITAAALIAVLAAAASRGVEGPAAWSLALLWAALAANAAASLLVPDRFEPAAPAGFAAAAAVGAGLLGLRGYELLVLAGLAYAAGLAVNRRQPNRGLYLLAVQGLLIVLAVLAVADLGADAHGLVAAGAAATAAQHLVRTALHRRLDGGGYSETSLWISLALLVLAPGFYALHTGTEARRDVAAVLLLLLLAAAVPAFARRHRASEARSGWILYPAALALGALPLVLSGLPDVAEKGLLPEPVLSSEAAGLVLLALGAAALWGETRRSWHADTRMPLLAASAGYAAAVLFTAGATGNAFLASAGFAMGGAVCLVLSYSRAQPWAALGTPPLLFAAALCLSAAVGDSYSKGLGAAGYRFLAAAWAAAALLQLLRAFLPAGRSWDPRDESAPDSAVQVPGAGSGFPQLLRRRIMGCASALVAAIAAVPAMASDSTAVAGSVTVIAAAALALPELPRQWREQAMQGGAVLTALAVQRISWLVLGGVNVFWSVQYWACVLAAMAGYEFLRRREQRGTAFLTVSAAILSASGLLTVISGGGGKQLWALVAHAGLLAFGLLASRRLFTMWGAAGVVLAVLWYLRGYTFLLLALLGVGLIALAVWRLTRVRSDADGTEQNRTHHSDPIAPAGGAAGPGLMQPAPGGAPSSGTIQAAPWTQPVPGAPPAPPLPENGPDPDSQAPEAPGAGGRTL